MRIVGVTPDGNRADEELVRSESRLRRAQRVARLGSWELNLETHVMWGSDEAFRIYGLPVTTHNTLPFDIVRDIPLAQDRPNLDRALADLVQRGTPYELRFRIRRHVDGAIRHVHSLAEVSRDSSGQPMLITGTIQDVTEHELAERALETALRANEERARLILEQAADAIFLGSSQGSFSLVNERACELTGYSREQLLGRDFDLLFDPAVLAARPLRFDRVHRGHTVVSERLLSRRDGTQVLVEMRAKMLSDGTLQAIVRDISERRRLEEQLQLRQRMDSFGTLAGGIAHDFNNILSAIVGYADLLRIASVHRDPHHVRAVEGILQAAQRAAELVRGLQSLSRPDPGRTESFDLHTVASEVFRVLGETTDRIITKDMAIPPNRFPVHGSASALYHALMNLGINAVQAIEEKGPRQGDQVTIEAEDFVATPESRLPLEPGPYVHVMMRDTGVGMSADVRERAFDPLFTTKEKGERKGQGLGLTMVYNAIVRQHGGLVDIETTEGVGSTFHLYLPRGRAAEVAEGAIATEVRGGNETILIIEDEPSIVDLTRDVLEQVGYRVLAAADGQDGVALFEENLDAIDLVLLDRTLPKLAGEQVLQRILVLRPDVKVVICSGDSSLDLSSFPGALRIMHKPFPPTLLYGVLREVLDGHAHA